MKILKLAIAAAIAVTGLTVSAAPAAAQPNRMEQRREIRQDRRELRHDRRALRHDRRDWNRGHHNGWRNHHRQRVCRTVWRHHHRSRYCYWRHW
jgi:hypothetical protein